MCRPFTYCLSFLFLAFANERTHGICASWDEQDDGARKPELKLVIPDLLKLVLVDDWEYVTRNHMVRLLVYIKGSGLAQLIYGRDCFSLFLYLGSPLFKRS